MKTISTGGVFARQRTKNKIKEILSSAWMRIKRSTFLISIAVTLLTLSSCDKQIIGQNADEANKNQAMAAADTLNKPKPQISVQVNKRYYEKGNMIGFDSTYSTFYSNVQGDTVKMDSLMNSFNSYFKGSHSTFFNRQRDLLFFDDSLRYPDFFHDDFFIRRYELNDQYLKESMKRMDSIKNQFFYEQSKPKKNSEIIRQHV